MDNAVQSFTASIQEDSLTAKKDPQFSNNSRIPANIKYLLVEKRKARAKGQRFQYPIDKARFNYLKNKL